MRSRLRLLGLGPETLNLKPKSLNLKPLHAKLPNLQQNLNPTNLIHPQRNRIVYTLGAQIPINSGYHIGTWTLWDPESSILLGFMGL